MRETEQNANCEPISVREIVNHYLIEQEFYYGKIPESDLNLRLVDLGLLSCIFSFSVQEARLLSFGCSPR